MNIGINWFNLCIHPQTSKKVSFGGSQNDILRLINENMGLVDEVLKESFIKIPPQYIEDIQSSGQLALCSAANEFDLSCSEDFRDYAKRRIFEAISKEVTGFNASKSREVSLYTNLDGQYGKTALIDAISDSRATQAGEDCTERFVRMPHNLPKEIKDAIMCRYGTQVKISNRVGNSLILTGFSDYDKTTLDRKSQDRLAEILANAIEKLPHKLKKVIELTFFKDEKDKGIAEESPGTETLRRYYSYAIDELKLIILMGKNSKDITREMIPYIFKDKNRIEIFGKVLNKLTPKQIEYFELYYGITKTPDGKYEYNGHCLSGLEIAEIRGLKYNSVKRDLFKAREKIKRDIDFVKMMSHYEKPIQYEGELTSNVIRYLFENDDRVEVFGKVLNKLTFKQREYFKLYYGISETPDGKFEYNENGLYTTQIAKKFGIDASTVSILLSGAQEKIKSDFEFIKIMSGYEEITPYGGEITPDVISYIFEDEARTKVLSTILRKLTSKKREYFKLHYGITEISNGEYEYNGHCLPVIQIADILEEVPQNVHSSLYQTKKAIKRNRNFIKMMQNYKKPVQYEGKLTSDVIKYLFEDKDRAEAFGKVLKKLTPIQREYFNLSCGITERPDGKYEYNGACMLMPQIAASLNVTKQAVFIVLLRANKKIKRDGDFLKIIQGYDEKH